MEAALGVVGAGRHQQRRLRSEAGHRRRIHHRTLPGRQPCEPGRQRPPIARDAVGGAGHPAVAIQAHHVEDARRAGHQLSQARRAFDPDRIGRHGLQDDDGAVEPRAGRRDAAFGGGGEACPALMALLVERDGRLGRAQHQHRQQGYGHGHAEADPDRQRSRNPAPHEPTCSCSDAPRRPGWCSWRRWRSPRPGYRLRLRGWPVKLGGRGSRGF